MARRSIGKPRFYADLLQYIKALGYYNGAKYKRGSDNNWWTGSEEVWNLDPTNNKTYTATSSGGAMAASYEFMFRMSEQSDHLIRLLKDIPSSESSGIYAGVLGHNLQNQGIRLWFGDNTNATAGQNATTNIINSTGATHANVEYDGFTLYEITEWTSNPNYWDTVRMNIGGWDTSNNDWKVGAITFGRFFEPEYAFDLKATKAHSYEGIKTQNTIGGNTLTNIKHLGQPMWGNDLPAWAIKSYESGDPNYNISRLNGRRQWQVGFSFLSDDKLFNKAGNPDQFFTYDEDIEQYTFDDSLSSFFKLTLNGNLPFIFCPDNDADEKEFALCRITNKPQFKQVANNLWGTSLVLTETW